MVFFLANLAITLGLMAAMKKISWDGLFGNPFSKRRILAVCAGVFLISVTLLEPFFPSLFPSLSLSLVVALVPYMGYDMFVTYSREKEQKQIVALLMVLSKWSCVKNDLVFCLRKAERAGLKKPVQGMLSRGMVRIDRGMDISRAIHMMEEESRGEDMRYMIRNIRFSGEKGGNIAGIFRQMEEQFFRMNEESYKRKISTFRDRMFVHFSMLMVLWVGFHLVSQNPSASVFYLETSLGNVLVGIFALLFLACNLLYLKK